MCSVWGRVAGKLGREAWDIGYGIQGVGNPSTRWLKVWIDCPNSRNVVLVGNAFCLTNSVNNDKTSVFRSRSRIPSVFYWWNLQSKACGSLLEVETEYGIGIIRPPTFPARADILSLRRTGGPGERP